MTQENLSATINLPEDVSYTVEENKITVKGPEGELTKTLTDKRITVKGDNQIQLLYERNSRKHKRLLYTNASRVQNMVRGVTDKFTYNLKVCSGHFPMQVSYNNNTLEIKNFIGESVPRTIEIPQSVNLDLDGEDITLTSVDKEKAGQVAGQIENLCKRPGFDQRIFQDGIYITKKPEKQTRQR